MAEEGDNTLEFDAEKLRIMEKWKIRGIGLANLVNPINNRVAGERDWPEDFSHENGNYECRCYSCKNTFVGHKRRVTCRLCYLEAMANPEKFPPPTKEQIDAIFAQFALRQFQRRK